MIVTTPAIPPKLWTGRANDWLVIHKEEYFDKNAAYRREREVKAWKSRLRIDRLTSAARWRIPPARREGRWFDPVTPTG